MIDTVVLTKSRINAKIFIHTEQLAKIAQSKISVVKEWLLDQFD